MSLATTFWERGVLLKAWPIGRSRPAPNGGTARRARKARQLLAETHPEPPPANQKTDVLKSRARPGEGAKSSYVTGLVQTSELIRPRRNCPLSLDHAGSH